MDNKHEALERIRVGTVDVIFKSSYRKLAYFYNHAPFSEVERLVYEELNGR